MGGIVSEGGGTRGMAAVGAVTAAAWAEWTTQRSRSQKRPDLAGLRVEQIHLAFFPIFGSLSCECHASASQLQMQIARWDATQQTHRFPPIGIGIGGERKNAKGRVGRPAHQSEQNTASLGASRGQRFVSCPPAPRRKKLALFSRDGAARQPVACLNRHAAAVTEEMGGETGREPSPTRIDPKPRKRNNNKSTRERGRDEQRVAFAAYTFRTVKTVKLAWYGTEHRG